MLTSVEAFWLEWQAQEEGRPSATTARAWLNAINGSPATDAPQPPDEAAVERFRQRGLAQLAPPTLDELEDRTARGNAHVSDVTENALKLFDVTKSVHRLRPAARRRLAHAARLHHLAGKSPAESAAALEALPPADVEPREHARLVALLRASGRYAAPTGTRPTDPDAKPDSETKVLAALLQLADALDYDQDQATRLETVTLTAEALVLRVRGLGAPDAARRVRLCRRLVKTSLNVGLRVTVAPPTLAEVQPLLAEPLSAQASVARGVQRGVAVVLLRWQAALERSLAVEAGSMAEAERGTAQMRQLLAVLRPILKRKATKQLRQRLGQLQGRLRVTSETQSAAADARAYAAGLAPEGAAQMRPLLETLDLAEKKALAETKTWLRSAQAAELCEDLLAMVGAPPLHHGPETTLRAATPELLKATLDTVSERLEVFEPSEVRLQHRLSDALVRAQMALEALGGAAVFGPTAATLVADWQTAECHLAGLRHLAAVDEAVGVFLDEWAVRQAKRKAPQLSGADAVLAYRHRRRTDRLTQRKALTAACRPLQGRPMATRVKKLLASIKPAAKA